MVNASVRAGNQKVIKSYLLNAVSGDDHVIGVVAEHVAIFAQSCGVGSFQHFACQTVADKDSQRSVARIWAVL